MAADGPRRLTERDVAYEELVPGIDLGRTITAAGTTPLGGGYMRFVQDAEFANWTLKYDEVLFVHAGELQVTDASGTATARAGEAVLISKGSTVTYRGQSGTTGFFVLWPRDWDRQ